MPTGANDNKPAKRSATDRVVDWLGGFLDERLEVRVLIGALILLGVCAAFGVIGYGEFVKPKP